MGRRGKIPSGLSQWVKITPGVIFRDHYGVNFSIIVTKYLMKQQQKKTLKKFLFWLVV